MRSSQAIVLTGADPGGLWSLLYFVRFSGIGFSLALPLLGAGTAARSIGARELLGLCLVAACFHVFAFVHNDVIDLPIDRTEPRRAGFPLVRGTIRPGPALAFALAQIPIAFALALSLQVRRGGLAALGVGFALMTIYNVWGKRSPVAWFTDCAQSLAWASLCLFGALALGDAGFHTGVICGCVVVYVLMANGVHGGLRDLGNDLDRGVRSTAIQLGARIGADGRPVPSTPLLRYAAGLQLVLFVLALLPFLRSGPSYAPAVGLVALAVVVASSAAAFVLLWSVRRPSQGRLDLGVTGLLHLVSSMLVLVAAVAPLIGPGLTATIVTVFLAPLLTHSASYAAARSGWRIVRSVWSR